MQQPQGPTQQVQALRIADVHDVQLQLSEPASAARRPICTHICWDVTGHTYVLGFWLHRATHTTLCCACCVPLPAQVAMDMLVASAGSNGALAGAMFWNAAHNDTVDWDGYNIKIDRRAYTQAGSALPGPTSLPASMVSPDQAKAMTPDNRCVCVRAPTETDIQRVCGLWKCTHVKRGVCRQFFVVQLPAFGSYCQQV